MKKIIIITTILLTAAATIHAGSTFFLLNPSTWHVLSANNLDNNSTN
jgi:hypothetical protein